MQRLPLASLQCRTVTTRRKFLQGKGEVFMSVRKVSYLWNILLTLKEVLSL